MTADLEISNETDARIRAEVGRQPNNLLAEELLIEDMTIEDKGFCVSVESDLNKFTNNFRKMFY